MPAVILRLLLLLLIAQVNLSAEDDTEEVAAKLDDEIHISQHELTIAGKIIGYTATTGRVLLYDPDEEDKAKARLFFTAYTTDKDKPSERPLTFIFNGGPGSSSVWLHLGCLGPRRLLIENDLESLRPPAEAVAETRFFPGLVEADAPAFPQSSNPHRSRDDPSGCVEQSGTLEPGWRKRPYPAWNSFPTMRP